MNNEETVLNGVKPLKDPITGKFVEGNPGGPGRPAFSLITMLKAELQKCPEGQDKVTYADMLIRRILKEAIEVGDAQQIKNILNYVEGMPKQSIEHSTPIEGFKIEYLTPKEKDEDNADPQTTPSV